MTPALLSVRFGTGLSPTIPAPEGPDEVLARLTGPDAAARAVPQPGWEPKVAEVLELVRLRKAARDDAGEEAQEAVRTATRASAEGFHRDLGRTLERAATTADGFRERLWWFWADHFAVADGSGLLRRTTVGYHEDALRPRMAGPFGDLLVAATTHPAMLTYLDQSRSVGPNSKVGRRGGGLNENLAREVLELHSLGVRGGYDQTDVRSLAELLTGLSVDRTGLTVFRENRAEPGAEVILGQSYGGDPARRSDIEAALQDIAVHPDTARHLSGKLARHFVADDPPGDLIDAMVAAWRRTDGHLREVYRAMLEHPAARDPELRKVRRPLDLLAAGMRALGLGAGLGEAGIRRIRMAATAPLARMGQDWQRPPGPQGWPEAAEAWITPQGLAARIEWAMATARDLTDPPDPRAFVEGALGPLARDATRFAAGAAETRADGVALVLAGPEFQRR